MYIKYWTNRLQVCPLHTLRLCYLLILENCILTTTIGITVIVISTSCGSLNLTSVVEYVCSHVTLEHLCTTIVGVCKSYLWWSFCNLTFLYGLFILVIIHCAVPYICCWLNMMVQFRSGTVHCQFNAPTLITLHAYWSKFWLVVLADLMKPWCLPRWSVSTLAMVPHS